MAHKHPTTTNPKQATIYDRLGGYRCIEKMVADFYQTILNDETLNIFYLQNVSDIADLHHLVTDFFCMIFGGPNNYKGRDMVESHKHMPIKKQHFEGVIKHMCLSFRKHKVNEDLIKEIVKILYEFYDQIVTVK